MNRPWFFVSALVLSVLHLIPAAGNAQPSTASSVATAGTGRASVEAGDVHELNPAMLVHQRGRDLHTSFARGTWNVGITDNSRDSVIAGALSWRQTRSEILNVESKTQDLRLTLADVVKGNFSMGVTGKQITTRRGEASWNQVNGDVGFAWIPGSRLGLATVFSDVFTADREVPEDLRRRPRTAFGVNYLLAEFMRLRLDLISGDGNNFGEPALLLGYESAVSQYFLVRLGAGTDKETGRDLASAGFGFDLPRFRLNYGVQTLVRGEGETWHTVDLGIPF